MRDGLPVVSAKVFPIIRGADDMLEEELLILRGNSRIISSKTEELETLTVMDDIDSRSSALNEHPDLSPSFSSSQASTPPDSYVSSVRLLLGYQALGTIPQLQSSGSVTSGLSTPSPAMEDTTIAADLCASLELGRRLVSECESVPPAGLYEAMSFEGHAYDGVDDAGKSLWDSLAHDFGLTARNVLY